MDYVLNLDNVTIYFERASFNKFNNSFLLTVLLTGEGNIKVSSKECMATAI